MKTNFSRSLTVILSLPVAGIFGYMPFAQATTPDGAPSDSVVSPLAVQTTQTESPNLSPSSAPTLPQEDWQTLRLQDSVPTHTPIPGLNSQVTTAFSSKKLPFVPAPGTALTSAAVLAPTPPADQSVAQAPPPLTDVQITPGTATRTSYSFIGFGANLGISGSKNALTNDVSFAIFSKIGLNPDISVRPMLLIRNDVYITLPVTFDFSPYVLEGGYRLGPYFGGGLAISTGNTSYIRPLLTAGVDVPLGPQFTGTAGFNFAFFDSVDVGVVLGIGYNFRGF
ncbi:hypothetical protein BST81_01080 [Leptolyngbya sp. 'hensonii']|uniref:hypothetical protein n=1 Tax=Leptolyngbya sp. 'hensonii' TaxID=1922337 RepID=UPI0009501409|nr:hypothetical protein [Leptolyngbya sp. 'hensonii']OLP20357.1 hypothetical protein BST81_01080 [Leptolyngbya sp. 'hensonii']